MTNAVGKFRSRHFGDIARGERDVDDEWGEMKKSKLGVTNIAAGKEM